MIQRRRLQSMLFSLVAAAALFAGTAQASPSGPDSSDQGPAANTATLKPVTLKPAKVRGKWRIAWDVRMGTIRGVLTLKQHADQVTGTFFENLNGQTYSLSGSVQGKDITFDIPFPSSKPYTIEFKGTVDREKMTGTSARKGGGPVYLGHGGEIVDPQHSWLAIKGLKHQLVIQNKPPKDDDD